MFDYKNYHPILKNYSISLKGIKISNNVEFNVFSGISFYTEIVDLWDELRLNLI